MNNNNNDLFRYERKFLLDKFTINSIKDLKMYTPVNLYEKYQERNVNSIYFDDTNFSLAYANIDGIFNRLKIRIRYYGNSNNLNSPKLEIKSKYGNVGKKNIFNLNIEEIYKNNFSLSFLKEKIFLDSPKYNFIKSLNPILKVSYKRNYFLSSCNRFRFTLDTDINFKSFKKNNFEDSLNNENLIYLNKNILELKYSIYNEGEASKLSQQLPTRLSSTSKYLIALNHLGLITL